jgi:hypothetical protein
LSASPAAGLYKSEFYTRKAEREGGLAANGTPSRLPARFVRQDKKA